MIFQACTHHDEDGDDVVKLILGSNQMIFQACTHHDEDVARGAGDEENHMLRMNVYIDT